MQVIEFKNAIQSLNQKLITSMISNNPMLLESIHLILSDPNLEDTLQLSASACYNLCLKHLINLKHNTPFLFQSTTELLLNQNINNTHKWVIAKAVGYLVELMCSTIQDSQLENFHIWVNFITTSLDNPSQRMSGLIVLDAIVDSRIEEESFIYFIDQTIGLVIHHSFQHFDSLSLFQLRAVGNILSSTFKRLENSQNRHKSVMSKVMLQKMLVLPRVYQLFNKVYLLNITDTIFDTSDNFERINLIKEIFSECHERMVENNGLSDDKAENNSLLSSLLCVLPTFLYSLEKAANEQKLVKKYHCQQLIIHILRIIKYTLDIKGMESSINLKSLVLGVLIPFMRTTQEDLKSVVQDPSSYFEEEEDICCLNQYDTLRSAVASLLEAAVNSSDELKEYLYYLCEESILTANPNHTLSKADALLLIAINSSILTLAENSSTVTRLINLMSNVSQFCRLDYFEKGRWLNLLSRYVEHVPNRVLKEYVGIVSAQTSLVYLNIRALDFIYNCADKIIDPSPISLDEMELEEDLGNNMMTGQEALQDEMENIVFNNNFLTLILDNLLAYVPTTNLQIFWTTFSQIVSIHHQIYSQFTYIKIVSSLYLRIQTENKSSSNQPQSVFNCLHIVNKIAQLCEPDSQLQATISQIFILLETPQKITFENQIVSILNTFLRREDVKIENYTKYLPTLYHVFESKQFIYESLFSTVNYFIKLYNPLVIGYDETVHELYRFCMSGLPVETKWFEEDLGDTLLLLQMFLYKFGRVLNPTIYQATINKVSFFKGNLELEETQHRLINTQILMLRIDNELLQEIRVLKQKFNQYNTRVMIVALGYAFLHSEQLSLKSVLFRELIDTIQIGINQRIRNICPERLPNNSKAVTAISTMYYSRNIDLVSFFWKVGFKPLEHLKDILIQVSESELDVLLNSLPLESKERFRQLNPLSLMNRRIYKVSKVKVNPTPFDMEEISVELRRIREEERRKEKESVQQPASLSYKLPKMQ